MEEKKKKGNWDQKSLQKAIDKVLSREMSLREASLRYDIPKSTLHDKTSLLNRGQEVTLAKPKIGRFTCTFTPEYEETLVKHVKDLSNRCLPLMKKEFLKLAFDLAETLKIPHRFNKELSNNLVSEEPTDPPQGFTREQTISSPKPSTSFDLDVAQIVHKLSPLPDAAKKRSAARKRKCEKSEILTSSPYKVAVEEKENEKNAKDKKKEMRNLLTTAIEKKGKSTKSVKTKGKSGEKAKKKQSLTETHNKKTTCVVCLEDHDEDWIQCSSCRGWAHEACADIPECSEAYVCDRCMIF